MLADEDQFLHAVAVGLVPVAAQAFVTNHHLTKLVLGHRSEPSTCIAQLDLLACLFEDIADLIFILEPADALGADHIARHLAGHKLVKTGQVEGLTPKINKGADAIFLSLAIFMIMIMMMVVMFVVIVIVIIIVVVMVFFLMMAFHFLDPGG